MYLICFVYKLEIKDFEIKGCDYSRICRAIFTNLTPGFVYKENKTLMLKSFK